MIDNSRIESFVHYILSVRGLSKRTAEVYNAALRNLSAYCADIDTELAWETLDADVVRGWLAAQMGRGVQARTIGPLLAAVRSFYRYLLREGVVTVDPVHKLSPPKCPKTLPQFLKKKEVEALLNDVQYPDTYEGARDRAIMVMLCTTGIRAAEILGMSVGDFSLDECQLKVTGKRNKQRIIPFGLRLKEALTAYLPHREHFLARQETPVTALFLNKRGRPMRYNELRKVVRTILGSVTSLKKRSPHVLRHTFATTMLDNGGDLEAIQQLLGHESVATTEIYTHTSFAELREQYAKAHPHAREDENKG